MVLQVYLPRPALSTYQKEDAQCRASAMATQSSGLSLDLISLSQRLLVEYDLLSRARIIAQAITESFADAAVNIYLFENQADEPVWVALASAGDARPDHEIPVATGAL